jgi:hypothetical protein
VKTGGRIREGLERRCVVERLMDHRCQLAVAVGAQSDLLDGVWPVAVPGEHLGARVDHLDRALELARRHRRQRRVVVRLERGAEGAAHERRHHADVLGRHAQAFCQMLLHAEDLLRLVEDRELIALPERDGRVRLDRVVVVDRNAVLRLDLDRRGLHRGAGLPRGLPFAVAGSGCARSSTVAKSELCGSVWYVVFTSRARIAPARSSRLRPARSAGR